MSGFGTYLTIAENIVQDHFGKSIPVFMDIKVTYRCNCQCKFCNCWKRENLEELDYEEHKRLIDQAKALGVRVVSYEGGEPLLRKDLPRILQYAKRKGMALHINTNGLLLEKEANKIVPWVEGVTISLDYSNEAKHDESRERKGVFKAAVRGILKVKERIPVSINVTLTRDTTKRDIIELSKMSRDMGLSINFQPVFPLPDTKNLTLERARIKELVELIVKLKKNGYPITNLDSYFDLLLGKIKVPCRAGDTIIFVHPDGRISFPCNQWNGKENFVGSIREKTLREIWFSKETEELRIKARSCTECCFGCTALLSLTTSLTSSWIEIIKILIPSYLKPKRHLHTLL